ncbi:lactate racemase domain-containing protein [Thermodesulfobacteriota bacterium]
MKVQLPQLIWHGNITTEIDLPNDWQVVLCPMRGATHRPLTIEQIETAVKNPIGSPTLRTLAKGKRKAVVIFDDITRPTRTHEIAPIVLRELISGDIKEAEITFVCALGAHGAHRQHEFRNKLGSEILEKFRVFNHNPYEHCVEVGTTRRGTRLLINREVIEADLRVGIGCVTAHPQVGFSGGGKIILPGVAHIDSISHYHIDVAAQEPKTIGLGRFDNNVLRFNIEDAARMAGLDFKVDVIVNDRGFTTAVFAGDFVEQHLKAVELAKEVYASEPRPRDMDLVIANAFAKANEMTIAVYVGAMALKDSSGTLVVIADAPEGQVPHYLLGKFGRSYGGRQHPVATVPPNLNLIVIAPHMDKTFADWFSNPEMVTWMKDWDSTLRLLKDSHGPGTKVAIIPNATMQYYASP